MSNILSGHENLPQGINSNSAEVTTMTELKNKLIELADSTRNEIRFYVGDTRDFLAVRLSTLQEIINLLGNKELEASEDEKLIQKAHFLIVDIDEFLNELHPIRHSSNYRYIKSDLEKMLNEKPNDAVSDTTGDQVSDEAGNIKKIPNG